MKENVLERVKLLISKGILPNERQISLVSGISQSTLNQQLNGARGMSLDTAIAILNAYGNISSEWLLRGEGPMMKDASWLDKQVAKVNKVIDNCTAAPVAEDEQHDEQMLPLLPVDALAGYVSVDNMGVSLADCDMYRVPEFTEKGAEMLIRVSGDSMYPTYHSGDKLACRMIHDTAWMQWGRVYVLDTDQGALVKRLYQGKDDSTITCHSDNEGKYEDFLIPKEAIRKMFVILGVIRME